MKKIHFVLKFMLVMMYAMLILPPRIWWKYWQSTHNIFLVLDSFISAPHVWIPGGILAIKGHWLAAFLYCLISFVVACVYRVFIIFFSHWVVKPEVAQKAQEFISEFLQSETKKRLAFLNHNEAIV